MLDLQEISDRLEIEELYARYVHGIDSGDRESLDRIFLPETVFDWQHAGGPRETWAEAKHGPMLKNELFPFVFHVCVNIVTDFSADRNSAVVRSKTIHPTGLYGANGEPVLFQVQGVYVDKLERTVKGWRILEREWHSAWAVGGLTLAGGIPDMLAAGRVQPPQ